MHQSNQQWGFMMTIEKELINKSYYQTMIDKNNPRQPIQVLGEMYMEEKQNEIPDFSSIRFAQGEIYFLNHDYEAAIFKWENVYDENLKPWAQKNIADAHFELNLLELAEDIYKTVEARSDVLNMEVLLQLFSLYTKQGKLEKATETIKNAVSLSPDYDCVAEMARTFFEEYKDWGNAVELAVNEAIRTKSLTWFGHLEWYVEQGLTIKIKPDFFNEALLTLFHVDQSRFEYLATALWNSYKQSDYYFPWLNEINQHLQNNRFEGSYIWKTFPDLFKETYYEMVSGRFLIKSFADVIPNHFANWMKISAGSDPLPCTSAILGWNEIFPSHLEASLVNEAENLLKGSSDFQNGSKDGIRLLESIKKWADEEGLLEDLSLSIEPMIDEYNKADSSTSKIFYILKKAIEFLIHKKVEMENAIIDKMNWNEELLVKLDGIHYQLSDMEEDKARVIKESFNRMKNHWRQELLFKIPELLQNCSDMVHEDSDFTRLHVDLNDEMNHRIAEYMENVALLDFEKAIQEWISACEGEFKGSQSYLYEISESINNMYGEEKIALNCDLKVLDDWNRDMGRIARGIVHFEKENIMLRNTPSQLLLKSVGKLFGTISKSKEKLHCTYKNFIENADYSQIAQSVLSPFIQQLELFERSIERDISLFFSGPFEVLNRVSEEARFNIEKHKDSIQYLRENPEVHRDPLTLFELQLRQCELMVSTDELIP